MVYFDKPLPTGAPISWRLKQVKHNHGQFFFGVTSEPPRNVIQDITSELLNPSKRYWVVEFPELLAVKDSVVTFEMDEQGNIIYDVNKSHKKTTMYAIVILTSDLEIVESHNDKDCGVFVCMNAEFLDRRLTPSFLKANIPFL